MELTLFGKKDLKRLMFLFWTLSITKQTAEGNMGANNSTPYDLLMYSSIDSIVAKRIQLEDANRRESGQSRWKLDSAQKARIEKRGLMIEFLDLLEGYKVTQEYLDSMDAEERAAVLEADRAEKAAMTPKQRAKAAKAKLAEIKAKKAALTQEDEEDEDVA